MANARYLTSREVADILGVSLGTVVNWEKQGRLVALRTPGGHRRFRDTDVQAFCRENGFAWTAGEVPSPEEEEPGVLLAFAEPAWAERCFAAISAHVSVPVVICTSPVELGYRLGSAPWKVLLLDVQNGFDCPEDLELVFDLLPRPPFLLTLNREGGPNPGWRGLSQRRIQASSVEEIVQAVLQAIEAVSSDSSGPWAAVVD